METKDLFQKYLHYGYQPILLNHKSKKPILKNWNANYQPEIYLYYLNKSQNYNIGFLLGDIIDIEGDSEAANHFLNNLFSEINHPIYQSYKSTHHLFRNYKGCKITRLHARGIEVRAHKHQSVVPPSVHELGGFVYEWKTPIFYHFEIPFLTESIEKRIKNYCGLHHVTRKPNSSRIICAKCKKFIYVNKNRLQLEIAAFQTINNRWNCHKCRQFNINQIVRTIKKASS